MNISIIKKSSTEITYLVEKANTYYINALRRAIIQDVPTMAIEDVEFTHNDSALYDEMVAHRLGLIPLKTDLKSYNLPENCTCAGEGCAKCQLKLTLSVKGPKTVYAEDLKSQDPKVVPVYPKMPIVKLLKDQKLEFVATAILGQGKEHSKWTPGLVYFKYKPELDVKKVKDKKALDASCPLKIYKDGKINEKKQYTCHLCENCVPLGAEVKINKEDFIFTVESWGQLKPQEMVEKGLDVIDSALDDFNTQIKDLK